MSDSDNDVNIIADLEEDADLVDDGHHDVPYDATDVPIRLSANDAPRQQEIEAAVYAHGIDGNRDDHIALFHSAPIATTSFSSLRRIWERNDVKSALRLLSGRHRLEIDPHLTINTVDSNILPTVGPHFLDLVMYVGDRRGLDAVRPNDYVDHTWRCHLHFNGIQRLWSDSKPTRLPFDTHGRMMSIGTRKEEQIWIAMVPNEWLVPDHPFNATGIWPRLPDPTSAMSSKHALMLVMFFAHIFHAMRLNDFTCREQYPELLTRRTVNDATDIFYRHGEATRDINLRIVDLEAVHQRFIDDWEAWVNHAPPAWKADRFLLDNTPVAVTMRYGQNQPILVPNFVAPERQSWKRDHKYDHIKHFTFSIASHISFIDVLDYEELPREEVAAKHPIAYDCYDPTTRAPVNLHTFPMENEFGDIHHVYDEHGFRIMRQKILAHQSTGALMDLSQIHTLFQTDEDDFGHVRNDVQYTVYPLAFTKNLGNVQADGVITPFARRINIIDSKLQEPQEPRVRQPRRHRRRGPRRRDPREDEPGLYSDGENSEEDDMDIDEEEPQRPPLLPLLHVNCSQIYNAISHRLRDAAKFHEVQLGLVTSSLAGCVATTLPSKNRWRRILERCQGDLPHVRCSQKIAGPGQPQCMRFENTYRLDVQRLPQRKRSGDVIYSEVITPLTKSWSHPTVIGHIKGACMVLTKDVVPELFQCTTYPLTCLIENIWKRHEPHLKEGYVVDPFELETISMLERSLNYAHTGSGRVLTKTLMDRAWLSLSVVNDGLPCLANSFIQAVSLTTGIVTIRREKWPVHPVTQIPLTASQRSQEITYGKPHFSSYLAAFTIKLAMKFMPGLDNIDINSDPLRHIATYAAEVALKSLINDVRNLVKNAVLPELAPIIDEGGIEAATAIARKKALIRWFKSSYPLSLDQDSHPALIEAVIIPVNGVMALKETRPASISVTKFVEDVLSHCNAQNPRRKPPFISDGQFLHVSRAVVREVTNFATRQGSCIGKDLERIICDGFVAACYTLKINQVPWSAPLPPGRRGAPSTRVAHDVWMGLGAKSQSIAPTSAAIRAHNNTPTAIARRTSEIIVANDNRGDWSAIKVTLKSFHSVLHKTVLPCEILQASPETSSTEDYIVQGYNFAIAAYDASKPLHHLALIAAIACSGLLPKVFGDTDVLKTPPNNSSEYTSFMRNLDWISRETRSRGVREAHIFVRMVTLYIICMYENDSPIVLRQNSKEKNTSNRKWVTKNSAKGITSFLLCRLGMAKIRTQRAFNSAQWNIDIGPLSNEDITILYRNVISRIKRDHKYGGYDAVEYMMGKKTADVLTETSFVTRRPTAETSNIASTSSGNDLKRGEREWDEEETYVTADVAGLQGQKRKVSRSY
ncbi:hypothetical protein L210DRAFT_3645009 [Boletus edulis BED1]|uniref:DUF8190 domain-containing protein n=1 Tax=Boletus edulis BED1 TaxID=1328754 RepID=A0AAD4BWX1_BOLED|nr:hypothetical protein L210DRAFT_3645009 [Boletus edulis BED1]